MQAAAQQDAQQTEQPKVLVGDDDPEISLMLSRYAEPRAGRANPPRMAPKYAQP